MKFCFAVFATATCAIQSTLAVSVRGGRAIIAPKADSQSSLLLEDSSEFLARVRDILFKDRQNDPTESHRSLQDDPPCGVINVTCTHGAVCKPNATRDGAEWCLCDVANGYINDTAKDIDDIVKHDLQGYRSCIQADECSNQSGMTNVCADQGGGCEDREADNGQYMCFCKAGYLAVHASTGDHGPEACDQVNECLIFENICGANKKCIDTPGSFECECKDDMVETQNGDCLEPSEAQSLTSCDPVLRDNCTEPERECDKEHNKCVCITGWYQPAGAGGQCQQENECETQRDVNCDRRGRGGSNPRSKCIDRDSLDGDGNARQGYTCECLSSFQDAPNAIRGTNCIEVEPDPSTTPELVIEATTTSSMPESVTEATPPNRPLPCTTFVCTAPFSFCAAEQNRCVCQSGYIQSLGSPFACEEICLADTDCLADEYCFESRCTACPVGAFREVASTDGCVNPCVSTTLGTPDPCPASCESSSSTDFTCLCEGTDLHCLQDDECNTGTGACQDCPVERPYRNENSQGGCVDPCSYSMSGPAPCRAQCESSSATEYTCVCSSDSDCLQDTECTSAGACEACAVGFFRDKDSSGGCVNPCQLASGGSPCPSSCVSSSSTEFTCQCPNDITQCPPDDTCESGTCSDCPASTPLRQAGGAQCVECVANTDCLIDDTCASGTCTDCPASTPHRPAGEAQCVQCVTNTDCSVNHTCKSGTCTACPGFAPLRLVGAAQCLQCFTDTDCPVDDMCDGSGTCIDCPLSIPLRPAGVLQCVECVANTHCPVDDMCTSGSCTGCPVSTPRRSAGEDQCVQCAANTDCAAHDTCDSSGTCIDCPVSTPLRPVGVPLCVGCVTNIDCPVDDACNSGTCIDCPVFTPLRPAGAAQCMGCFANIECPVNEICNNGSCMGCPGGTPFRPVGSSGCVECVMEADCPDDKICADGECIEEVQVDAFITTIAVIDESSIDASTIKARWNAYRASYPNRRFCLLQPAGSSYTRSRVREPAEFLAEISAGKAIYAEVNRDDGNAANADDWFNACDLAAVAAGGIPEVAIFIDTSGSMTCSTVSASNTKFLADLTAQGIALVGGTSNSAEDWITPFNQELVGSMVSYC